MFRPLPAQLAKPGGHDIWRQRRQVWGGWHRADPSAGKANGNSGKADVPFKSTEARRSHLPIARRASG